MHRPMNKQASKGAKNMKKALKTIALYCRKYWGVIAVALLCAIVSAVLSVIGPNYISKLTQVIQDGISSLGVNIDLNAVSVIGFTLIGIYATSMILNYLQHFIMNHVSCNVGKKMRTNIIEKINKVPLKYFDSHNNGDTLSRVTNDVDLVTQSLNNSIGSLVSAIATLIGCIVMMFSTQWLMAITAIASSFIGFVLMAVIMKFSQKHFIARQQSLALVSGHIEEYYAGQNIIRAYNGEAKSLNQFREENEKLRKHTFKAEFLSSLMMPIMSFIGNFGYVAVCIVGSSLAFNGIINFSVVVAFMIYIRLFTSPFSQIAQGFSGLQSAAASSERVEEFLSEEELIDENNKKAKLDVSKVKGDVVFKDVNFGYSKDRKIIKDFSLKVKAGQKVAIVGPTGAGKTTIVNLLMRFYETDGGRILVDDVALDETTRENVHDIFGMVLQDTWLFEGTIRENLSFGKKGVTDDEILDVLHKCGLSHFVSTLPNGLDTVLNDNVTISLGQKQLLTIARAMIENAPMLILDEATSSVDTKTELMIQNAMDKLTQNRTSFVIAHRLSTIKNADVIIYMQDGEIKETGSHNELLAKNGLYAELYNSQFAVV